MSDAPETQPPPQGGPARPSQPPPPPPPRPLNRALPLDPAAMMIGVGAVVLVLALWWLWATPRATETAAADEARIARMEQRIEALREQVAGMVPRVQQMPTMEQRLSQLAEVEGRLRAVEQRPMPPDIRPLESQVAMLTERLAGAERRLQAAENRPAPPDIRPLEQQIASLAGRLQALEGRPTMDPQAVATRQSVEQLVARTAQLGERLEALATRQQEAARATEQRAAEAQQAAQQRIAALEQTVQQKLTGIEQAVQQRLGERIGALEQQLGSRIGAVEQQLGSRIGAVEQAQQRLAATTGQALRLATIDTLRAALAGGQPLGPALQRIENPPQALARFAQAAPPTEASLRLSFEDAVRAARAASDAAARPNGGERAGVAESALARLGGLVTVRRGDQVVWGDASEAVIEKARRALEAGDLEQAVSHLETLPQEPRKAMQGWIDQAKALLAARAALWQMATAG